ncbi:hypothetical protein B0H10DRAFT_2213058 [Mycena sp. CBHHK59/15]|nr:hypothetical protein B0H10DRAFT_2213058 [Mycena sp. CBHHK59/15]
MDGNELDVVFVDSDVGDDLGVGTSTDTAIVVDSNGETERDPSRPVVAASTSKRVPGVVSSLVRRKSKKERDASAAAHTPLINMFVATCPLRSPRWVPLDIPARAPARSYPLIGNQQMPSPALRLQTLRPSAAAIAPSMQPRCPDHHRYSEGSPIRRCRPLQLEDLWLEDKGPPPSMEHVDDSDICAVCLQLKSHPVS